MTTLRIALLFLIICGTISSKGRQRLSILETNIGRILKRLEVEDKVGKEIVDKVIKRIHIVKMLKRQEAKMKTEQRKMLKKQDMEKIDKEDKVEDTWQDEGSDHSS